MHADSSDAKTSAYNTNPASLPFRPLSVAVYADQWVRLPAREFLLVLYIVQIPKMYRFSPMGTGKTDRQTDGRMDRRADIIVA